MRVVIVGAGAAGLASAKQLTTQGIECEILEMKSELGGTWVYTDDIDKDEYGFPVYSAMYKDLRTNLPKELMGFEYFPVPANERSYLTQPEILEFLNLYVDHFKLRSLIQLNRMVTEVRPLGKKWQVKSIDKPTRKAITATYDAIMICSGNFNVPNKPKLTGEENFQGRILHSQKYRSAEPFKNQKVLVIGGGPSGFDLCQHLSSVADHVVLSHHNEIAGNIRLPSNVYKKPDVLRIINGKEVEFTDNSVDDFDTIILATGYKYSYPFLHPSCGITIEDNYIQPLFKQIININNPTMGFIGIPVFSLHFLMFDLQARFFCRYLTGDQTLPSVEDMKQDTEKLMKKHWAKGYPRKLSHFLGPEQEEYFKDLAATADLQPIASVYLKLFSLVIDRLFNHFQAFRGDRYKIVDYDNYVWIK